MRTTISIDDDLVKLAREQTHSSTAAAAIRKAMQDWARRLRLERVKALAGTLDFEMGWREMRDQEHKAEEKRMRSIFGPGGR